MGRPSQPVHPLGPILFFGIAALVFWVPYHFFGIGKWLFETSAGTLLIVTLNVCVVLVFLGIPYGLFKLANYVRSRLAGPIPVSLTERERFVLNDPPGPYDTLETWERHLSELERLPEDVYLRKKLIKKARQKVSEKRARRC